MVEQTPEKKPSSFVMASSEYSGEPLSQRKLLRDESSSQHPRQVEPFHRGSIYGTILSGSSSPQQTIRSNSIIVQSFGNFQANGLEINEIQAPDSVIIEEVDEVDITKVTGHDPQQENDSSPPRRPQSKTSLK